MALMAMMLDSDTCISIMKRDPHMKPKAALGDCAISQIVLGELEYGVCNSPSERQQQNRQSLYDFLSTVQIYPLSNEVAAFYGDIRAFLRRQETRIGPNDLWIAAHALAGNIPLVTNNTREFERVPKLKIETWMTK